MAEAATPVTGRLACPSCFAEMKSPISLTCHHLFCQGCVGQMKSTDTEIFECYICTVESTEKEHHRMTAVSNFLSDLEKAGIEEKNCFHCNTVAPSSRCVDCKQNFCDSCRKTHDRFPTLTNHAWEAFSDIATIIDKHEFCALHKNEALKLYCTDCRKLICLICNGTEHKTHTAEIMDNALKKLTTKANENIATVKQSITHNESALKDSIEQSEIMKKIYEDIEKEIDDKCEELINIIRDDAKRAKKELRECRSNQAKGAERAVKVIEATIQHQKNIVTLGELSTTCAQDTSLLHVLQSGVDACLERSSSSESSRFRPYSGALHAGFAPTTDTSQCSVGRVYRKSQASELLPCSLSTIANATFTMYKEISIGFFSHRFSMINGKIWCNEANSNKVHIYTYEGEKTNLIEINNTGTCYSMGEFSSGMLIAASQGLYRADMNGGNAKLILAGDICDVSLSGDKLCALNNATGRVVILEFNLQRDTFAQIKEIPVPGYKADTSNTIQCTTKHVYICNRYAHTILQYDYSGKLISTPGPGTLKHPYLCGVDANGAVLVADYSNNCLRILQPTGSFQPIILSGLLNPTCVTINDNILIVVEWSSNNNKLKLYQHRKQ